MKGGLPRRGPGRFCALALLAGLALLAPAASAGASGGSTATRALRFWTPARMREAKPIDVRPGTVSTGGQGAKTGISSAVKFEPVADPAAPAMRRNGVIFFVADGYPARCSGTSVGAPNHSLVFTAGHCVFDGETFRGGWYGRLWIFVPGYRYGQRPFGVFPAERLDATHIWTSKGSENGDVGAAVVGRNELGQRLQDAVGGDRIAWNLPARQHFDIHGYPAAAPFDGETQRLCPATPFRGHDYLSFLEPGPLNLTVSCDVTGGASGGGWTIHGDVLNSVTDYGYPSDPSSDFGSYFGAEVGRLYKRMSR